MWLDKACIAQVNARVAWHAAQPLAARRSPLAAHTARRASRVTPQDDIEANLASLPVFLAGCSELLLLAGPTYCERLWCVIELFVFLRMGGSLSRVSILPVGGGKTEPAEFRAVASWSRLRNEFGGSGSRIDPDGSEPSFHTATQMLLARTAQERMQDQLRQSFVSAVAFALAHCARHPRACTRTNPL